MTHIIVDAMGGDNAPQAVVEGCLKAIKDFDIKITLVGKEDAIRKLNFASLLMYKVDLAVRNTRISE